LNIARNSDKFNRKYNSKYNLAAWRNFFRLGGHARFRFWRVARCPEFQATVADNRRCSEIEIRAIIAEARRHQAMFLERWNEHFGN
jgi:hypothetical protein